jgi:hypothetical protein
MIENFNLDNDFYYSLVDGASLKLKGVPTGVVTNSTDLARLYNVNSYGYRGKEFSSDDRLVVAGCSYTYALGVPEETSWHELVSKELNLSKSSSVAKIGASISLIVEKLFSYFSEFGNPEYLLCLFPDPHRYAAPLDGVVLDFDGERRWWLMEPGTSGTGPQITYNYRAQATKRLVETSYIKRPYDIKQIYTPEMTLHTSIRAIRTLEQYCKVAGIKLLWTTWDDAFVRYLDVIQKNNELKFSDYFDLNFINYKKKVPSGYRYNIYNEKIMSTDSKFYHCSRDHKEIDCNCSLDCHQELIDIYGERNFLIGTDKVEHESDAHPGIHTHRHYADRFIEELTLQYPNKFK